MGLFIAQILTGLANAGALFMVASGLSLIFGVTRVVNFAHGSFYMLGAYVGYSLMQVLPGMVGFWGAILLAGLIVGVIGVIVEICVLRPVYSAPELFQLVATFGVILVIQDLALMIWGPTDLLGPRAPGLKGVIHHYALCRLHPVVPDRENPRRHLGARRHPRPRDGRCPWRQSGLAVYGRLLSGLCACRAWRRVATAQRRC